MDRAQFYKEVYSITKEIPYGNVFTYGKIAQLIGNPQYSRMVGQALSYAPKEEDLPCHRVVNSQGRLVPSWQKQKELLEKEGITEIHYIGNLEKKLDFIPGYAAAPWMISGMGILYGRK